MRGLRTRLGTIVALVAASAALLIGSAALRDSPGSDPALVGRSADSFAAPGVVAPTGEKPQAKLWYHSGSWWGARFSLEQDSFTIYRFDVASDSWLDTGVIVDTRNAARVDVLSDGDSLYTIAATTQPHLRSASARLRRFTFDPELGGYTPDEGYPIAVTEGGMESAVMAMDSAGVLWVTFTRDQTVYVTHSEADTGSFVEPYALPVEGAMRLDPDDVSAAVAFGGNVGVMWSNQRANSTHFAIHAAGAPDSEWSSTAVLAGNDMADDHINLASDPDGRVYAVVKTSLNQFDDPLILLLVRDLSGNWRSYDFGTVTDAHTRPVLAIDAENRRLFVLASAPCCDGGKIYYKTTSLDDISFPAGLGTVLIESEADPLLNNATTTKQMLNSTSGLLALASDDSTKRYRHALIPLGPDADPPETVISAGPVGTALSQSALFEFSSNELGAVFECRLDAEAFSACESPQAYESLTLGQHVFEVRARDLAGNVDPSPASRLWTVTTGTALVFRAVADTYAAEANPSLNFGSRAAVTSDGGLGVANEGLVRFDVSGLADTVIDARLRIYVTNPTTNGPSVFPSGIGWDESTVTWASRPPVLGDAVFDAGPISSVDVWYEIDVTEAVSGDGVYGFTFISSSTDALGFASRETTTPPELIVTTG